MEGRTVKYYIIGFLVGVGLAFASWFSINTLIQEVAPPEQKAVAKTSSTKVLLPPTSHEIEIKLNEFRTAKGLSTFNTEVPALDEAAQARAEEMCATNDWSHSKDWAVLDKYYAYSYAGENLYYGSLQENQAANAVRDWSNSPTHLANMVGGYTQVGIGVKACPGFQGSNDAIIITNYFGVPR